MGYRWPVMSSALLYSESLAQYCAPEDGQTTGDCAGDECEKSEEISTPGYSWPTYLVVAQELSATPAALRYAWACVRSHPLGQVALLLVTHPSRFSYFAGIEKQVQDDQLRYLHSELDSVERRALDEESHASSAPEPQRFIEQGPLLEALERVMPQLPGLAAVVVSNEGKDRPNTVLAALFKEGMEGITVPIHIIPDTADVQRFSCPCAENSPADAGVYAGNDGDHKDDDNDGDDNGRNSPGR